jgi:hypothetical protein
MIIPDTLFIISRFSEDLSWLNEIPLNHLIYNKGAPISEYNSMEFPNYGGNQHDIFHFVYNNYDNLPNITGFLQANPWDHCSIDKFKELMTTKEFAPLESFGPLTMTSWNILGDDGGFCEINNSWYISAHNDHLQSKGVGGKCSYTTFDDFMNDLFLDYHHLEWIRFTPGSQYIVPKNHFLHYPKEFWEKLMNMFPTEIGTNGGTMAHIIERALWLILKNVYTLK